MKQTAVEWLIEKVNSKEWQDKFIWHKEEDFKQAKEMEKEQIVNAFVQGDLFSEDYLDAKNPTNDCAENYYNETFKSE